MVNSGILSLDLNQVKNFSKQSTKIQRTKSNRLLCHIDRTAIFKFEQFSKRSWNVFLLTELKQSLWLFSQRFKHLCERTVTSWFERETLRNCKQNSLFKWENLLLFWVLKSQIICQWKSLIKSRTLRYSITYQWNCRTLLRGVEIVEVRKQWNIFWESCGNIQRFLIRQRISQRVRDW